MPRLALNMKAMRRLRATLFGLGFVGVAAGGGAYAVNWWELRQLVVSTDNAYVRADTVEVASRVAGYIEDIHVSSHQTVRAGDPLLTIRGERFEAAVDAARADLRAAEGGRGDRPGRRRQHEGAAPVAKVAHRQAEARVVAARAEADQAAREAERYAELLERGAGARQKHEAAETARRTALAEVARAEAELAAARDRVPVFDSDVLRLERDIDRLRAVAARAAAALDSAEIALSDTLVTTPIDGYIGNMRVEPGMYTEAGWPVMAVAPLHATYIIANSRRRNCAGCARARMSASKSTPAGRRADGQDRQLGAGERR